MDYVIAGLMLGSLLAIAGYMAREAPGKFSDQIPGWLHDVGTTLMLSGVVVWGIAAVASLSDIDSGSATSIVLATTIIGVIASLCVGWFERQHSLAASGNIGTIGTSVAPVAELSPDDQHDPNPQDVAAGSQRELVDSQQSDSEPRTDWLSTWSEVLENREKADSEDQLEKHVEDDEEHQDAAPDGVLEETQDLRNEHVESADDDGTFDDSEDDANQSDPDQELGEKDSALNEVESNESEIDQIEAEEPASEDTSLPTSRSNHS